MNNIKTHPIVYFGRYERNEFHLLIEQFALYLGKYYNATLIDITDTFNVNINNIESKVLDCELLIHWEDTDIIYAISFCDSHSELIELFQKRNKECDKLMYSQYTNTGLFYNSNYKFQLLHSIYTASYPYVNLDMFHKKRLYRNSFDNKLIFRGNVNNMGRNSINLLYQYDKFYGGEAIHEYKYFDELTKYKVGLSISGIGELCFRDIEYLAIGIPMMRFKYLTELNPPLIPNFHYISIDSDVIDEKYIENDRNGGEYFVEKYIKRFEEVKDDIEFLDYISINGRQYYKKYLHPNRRINHIISIFAI